MRGLPKLTRQPILYVDATPDENYPLRILRAYREDCKGKWADTTDGGETDNPLLVMMNKHCDQRVKILDGAIRVLKQARSKRKQLRVG